MKYMELINAELVVLKDRLCKIENDQKNDDTSNDIKKLEKLCEKNNKILDKEIDVSSSRSQQVITIRDQTEWVELLKEDSHQLCKPEDLYDVYKKILNIKSKFSSKIFGNGDACDLITKSIFNYIS